MRNFKSVFSATLLSFGCWMLFVLQDFNLTKIDSGELIAGGVVSLIVGFLTAPLLARVDGFWLFKKGRIFKLIAYIPYYMVELWKANVDVAKKSFSRKLDIKPGILKVETDLKSDYGLAMLANSITLTPGTITMDIFEENEKNYLYIHWIDVQTEDRKEAGDIIKGGFEKKIRGIFE